MIFDVIYDFYNSLFSSDNAFSSFWENWPIYTYHPNYGGGSDFVVYANDYFSAICTAITIICGIFALFRILGGILKLFKV